MTVFERISISGFDWILNAPLVATFKMFLNFSVSQCKLITITLEKSTVNNELKKIKNKKKQKNIDIPSQILNMRVTDIQQNL